METLRELRRARARSEHSRVLATVTVEIGSVVALGVVYVILGVAWSEAELGEIVGSAVWALARLAMTAFVAGYLVSAFDRAGWRSLGLAGLVVRTSLWALIASLFLLLNSTFEKLPMCTIPWDDRLNLVRWTVPMALTVALSGAAIGAWTWLGARWFGRRLFRAH